MEDRKKDLTGKKIGLAGGTFDPIHIGHVLMGQWAREVYGLDEVWFLPTGTSYFMGKTQTSDGTVRLKMTELALKGLEGMEACDLEIKREGKTYTWETVEELKVRYPDTKFYFIFGEDCLYSLEKWVHPEKILAGCDIIACTRGEGRSKEELEKRARWLMERLGGRIHVMDFPVLDISSTLIRERVAEGKSIHLLVPEAVEEYIREENLYV